MESKNRAGVPVMLKNAFSSNGSILIVLLLFLFCGIRFGTDFLNATNLLNIVKQMSITGIAAIGINFVIISGGRDLSCGSIAAVSAIIAAFLTPYGILPALLGGLAVGLVFGLFNGFIITYMGVTPLIGTLGTQWAIRSIALPLNNNTSEKNGKQTGVNGLHSDSSHLPTGISAPKQYAIYPFSFCQNMLK